VNFNLRHSEGFSEVYSRNDVSLLYKGALARKDSASDPAAPVKPKNHAPFAK